MAQTHAQRVMELADVFIALVRPDLARPLMDRLRAQVHDHPGVEERLERVVALDDVPEPPPPLVAAEVGLRPEQLIERCLFAGALATARDLLEQLLSCSIGPPMAVVGLQERLESLHQILGLLARRELVVPMPPAPSVQHAEHLIAQGRLFDALEEYRLVAEQGGADAGLPAVVADLERLLAPMPDVQMTDSGRGEPPPTEPETPDALEASQGNQETAALGDSAELPAIVQPSQSRWAGRESSEPSTEPDDGETVVIAPAHVQRLGEGSAGQAVERGGAAHRDFDEETVHDRPGARARWDAPADDEKAASAGAGLGAVPMGDDLVDDDPEPTALSLTDPKARRLIGRGDFRAALVRLRAQASLSVDGTAGSGLEPFIDALERLAGAGPEDASPVATDAETALVGGELERALSMYARAAEERPDRLDIVARSRDLQFLLYGGPRPRKAPRRASFSREELQQVLLKRGGHQRLQSVAQRWVAANEALQRQQAGEDAETLFVDAPTRSGKRERQQVDARRLEMAESLERSGSLQEALRVYEQLSEEDVPDDALADRILQLRHAIDVEEDPESTRIMHPLTVADQLRLQGYLEQALDRYERVLAQRPGDELLRERVERLRRQLLSHHEETLMDGSAHILHATESSRRGQRTTERAIPSKESAQDGGRDIGAMLATTKRSKPAEAQQDAGPRPASGHRRSTADFYVPGLGDSLDPEEDAPSPWSTAERGRYDDDDGPPVEKEGTMLGFPGPPVPPVAQRPVVVVRADPTRTDEEDDDV